MKPRWIAATAPECFSVFMTRIAPKTIASVASDSRNPSAAHAAAVRKSCRQYASATASVASHPIGNATLAGIANASMATTTIRIGSEAISASIKSPVDGSPSYA